MDNDGDMDILATAYDANKISWWENSLYAPTSIENEGLEELAPQSTFIRLNYPNPFNSSTTMVYGLSDVTHVRIDIYASAAG